MLADVDAGAKEDPSKILAAQFLRSWLDQKTDIEARTRETYSYVINKHLIPEFGKLTLDRLDRPMIRSLYARWLKEGRIKGNGGVSPATIRKFHTVLREALQTAVEDGLVVRNVAAGVVLPKDAWRERRALSPEECAQLLNGARRSRLFAPILLALVTGMRRGELLGLKWADLDLELARVAIRRSLERTSDGLRLKAPKSNRARVVALPATAVDILWSHRAAQHEERLRCGAAWANNGLVFPSLAGSPWDPSNFSTEFRRLAKMTGSVALGRTHFAIQQQPRCCATV